LKINRLFPIKFVILSAKVHKGIFIALVKEENKTKNKKNKWQQLEKLEAGALHSSE